MIDYSPDNFRFDLLLNKVKSRKRIAQSVLEVLGVLRADYAEFYSSKSSPTHFVYVVDKSCDPLKVSNLIEECSNFLGDLNPDWKLETYTVLHEYNIDYNSDRHTKS